MEWIKAIFDFIWAILNLPISFGGFKLTYFSVIVFAIVCGLFFKLMFGGAKKDD